MSVTSLIGIKLESIWGIYHEPCLVQDANAHCRSVGTMGLNGVFYTPLHHNYNQKANKGE